MHGYKISYERMREDERDKDACVLDLLLPIFDGIGAARCSADFYPWCVVSTRGVKRKMREGQKGRTVKEKKKQNDRSASVEARFRVKREGFGDQLSFIRGSKLARFVCKFSFSLKLCVFNCVVERVTHIREKKKERSEESVCVHMRAHACCVFERKKKEAEILIL